MPTTARPDDVRACPDCRRTFPSRQALRRHGALDHRPAPDGARLTARIIGTSHTTDDPHRAVAGGGSRSAADRSAPAPAARTVVAPDAARVPWLLVWALVGLAVLAVPAGALLAFAPLVLASALCMRRQLRRSRSHMLHDDSRAPEA